MVGRRGRRRGAAWSGEKKEGHHAVDVRGRRSKATAADMRGGVGEYARKKYK